MKKRLIFSLVLHVGVLLESYAVRAFLCNYSSSIIVNAPPSFKGYTLVSPNRMTNTWLIDDDGFVVHIWPSSRQKGQKVELLEDGRLFATRFDDKNPNPIAPCDHPPAGGYVEVLDWDGTILLQHHNSDTSGCQHHDATLMPSGNFLEVVWETRTAQEAQAAGSNLSGNQDCYPDSVQEVNPETGEVVWSWHICQCSKCLLRHRNINHSVWNHRWTESQGIGDHLVQDQFPNRDNYVDSISQHPGKLDINSGSGCKGDWNHVNGIDYNADLDQIALSAHHQNELWIIDHSCSSEEAATDTGCRGGVGGDLLYRWGNPQIYGRTGPQQLSGQHHTHWVSNDYNASAAATNMLIFNNAEANRQSAVKPVAIYTLIKTFAGTGDTRVI